MQLVVAQDNGRLSEDDRIGDLFSHVIDVLASHDATAFVRQVSAIKEPHTLFWHENAEDALNLLSHLQLNGIWPTNLKGVVLFGMALFAGLTAEDPKNALRSRGLDESNVLIFSDVVGYPPTPDIVDRIRAFYLAACDTTAGRLPFGLLEPKCHGDGVFTLLVLSTLMDRDRQCGEVAMRNAHWTTIVSELNEIGITCQPEPNVDDLRQIARIIRTSGCSSALRCPGCGERSNLIHLKLDGALVGRRGVQAKTIMKNVTTKTEALLSDAEEFASGYKTLFDKLAIEITDNIKSQLLETVATVVQQQCALVKNGANIRSVLGVINADLQSSAITWRNAAPLKAALDCNATEGLRF